MKEWFLFLGDFWLYVSQKTMIFWELFFLFLACISHFYC